MSREALDLAKVIKRIVSSGGTKADRARQLFDLGCDRTDVVELLGMTYGQAHSIWKETHGGNGTPQRAKGSQDQGAADNVAPAGPPTRFTLRLSPSQTRVATQDGHRIIKVDREASTECRECGKRLTYSIHWLAFVHSGSQSDPTELEDYYAESEVANG